MGQFRREPDGGGIYAASVRGRELLPAHSGGTEIVEMANKICKIPFKGTPNQEKELKETIARLKGQQGALMPILQEAQGIYGYLPIEVLEMISREMDIPLEEIYGVATFYSQFSLNPKGQYKISVCLGTACYVKGAGAVFERLSEKLGIQSGECTAGRQVFSGSLPVASAPADWPLL